MTQHARKCGNTARPRHDLRTWRAPSAPQAAGLPIARSAAGRRRPWPRRRRGRRSHPHLHRTTHKGAAQRRARPAFIGKGRARLAGVDVDGEQQAQRAAPADLPARRVEQLQQLVDVFSGRPTAGRRERASAASQERKRSAQHHQVRRRQRRSPRGETSAAQARCAARHSGRRSRRRPDSILRSNWISGLLPNRSLRWSLENACGRARQTPSS
jgi:hypothetical protein